jgi:hypothetical protein
MEVDREVLGDRAVHAVDVAAQLLRVIGALVAVLVCSLQGMPGSERGSGTQAVGGGSKASGALATA